MPLDLLLAGLLRETADTVVQCSQPQGLWVCVRKPTNSPSSYPYLHSLPAPENITSQASSLCRPRMSSWGKLPFSYEKAHDLWPVPLWGSTFPSTQVGALEVPRVPSLSPALMLFPRQQLLSFSSSPGTSRKIIQFLTSSSQGQKREAGSL